MRTLLVALLTVAFGAVALPVAAQDVSEKAAPEDVHLLLTRQHRMGMTHARRVELSEPSEREDAVREVAALGDALDAAAAELDEVAKVVGPENAAKIDLIRKQQQEAKQKYELLKAEMDKPRAPLLKAHAAAVRNALDAAEDAHQKLMASPIAPKPDSAKPPVRK